MGKGRILSGGADGLYTIEILEDRTRAETARKTAVQRVANLDNRISELSGDLAAAQSEVDAAAAAQDQAIADYQAALDDPQLDTEDARQAMVNAGEAVIQVAAKRDAIARNIGALKSERLALQRRIDLIDGLPPLRQQSAWCADYTEDLSGDVATAEVPGEIGKVIIQPGFDGAEASSWPSDIQGGATWTAEQDGAIQPALSGTAASVFYNLALMPGWQKWRPTFRVGTISNLNADLCDVTLDAATSSQQSLNVNAQASYTSVPIYYMDCNGDAFEDGDRVLVAFSGNTDQPMVIGFEKEPKPCEINYIAYRCAISEHVGSLRIGEIHDGYPVKPPNYIYDYYINRSETRINVSDRPRVFYGYSRKSKIDGLTDIEDTPSARIFMLTNTQELIATASNVEDDKAVQSTDLDTFLFTWTGWIQIDEELGSKSVDITTLAGYKDEPDPDRPAAYRPTYKKYNVQYTNITINPTSVDVAWTDSGSDGYGMYQNPDPNIGGTLYFSDQLTGNPDYSWSATITMDGMPDSIEHDGKTYLPNRMIHLAHDAANGYDKDLYIEYIRDGYTEEAG